MDVDEGPSPLIRDRDTTPTNSSTGTKDSNGSSPNGASKGKGKEVVRDTMEVDNGLNDYDRDKRDLSTLPTS